MCPAPGRSGRPSVEPPRNWAQFRTGSGRTEGSWRKKKMVGTLTQECTIFQTNKTASEHIPCVCYIVFGGCRVLTLLRRSRCCRWSPPRRISGCSGRCACWAHRNGGASRPCCHRSRPPVDRLTLDTLASEWHIVFAPGWEYCRRWPIMIGQRLQHYSIKVSIWAKSATTVSECWSWCVRYIPQS